MKPYIQNTITQHEVGSAGALWNILTMLVILCVLGVIALFLMIFINPYSEYNPFPPPTQPVALSLPTETATLSIALPSTWTPTDTPLITPSNTPTPTLTPSSTATPITLTPEDTATPTRPPSGYPFEVRQGSPKAIPNIYHPELDCNWLGVGGQAVDMGGGPVVGLIIQLGGDLPGVSIPQNTMSLTGVALDYGRAGYEFKLADRPITSIGTLWLQLLNQSGGPLSEKVYFNTYDNCEQNLIIIDFRQVR